MTRPGRADDDLRALLQSVELALVGLPAVNRQRVDAAFEERELVDFLGHLHGQFACGAENEHLHRPLAHVGFLNGGNGEGRRFAGAGLRLADDIVPLHEHRNGLGLNGRGLLEAELVDAFQQFGERPSSENSFMIEASWSPQRRLP